jgi:CheY-like chemotaxis protein/two-component sensor histidine kinase
LRTPLHGVIGVLQLLDDGSLNPEQRRRLKTAAVSGETLLALIDAILEHARLEIGIEAAERRNFHLDHLIEAATELMRPQAEAKGLTLVLDIDAAAQVNGDPVRLNRVLLNLLSNAIKFTEHGRVDVRAVLERSDNSEMRLRLSVTDTGIGIAPEMQERIFEDFVQADDSIVRRFGGTGLGLAISRRLTQLMGGDLEVKSTLGAGSVFQLTLPLAPAEVRAPARDASVSTRPLALLLVDDDPVNRDIGAALLRLLGHEPTVAAGGRSAVELARSQVFDAVLIDIHMPDMDGFETAELIQLLPCEPKPRIIALTADVSERTRERLVGGGIHAIVRKPVLLDVLRRALAFDNDVAAIAERFRSVVADRETLVDVSFLARQQEILGAVRLTKLRQLFAESSAELIQGLVASAEANEQMAVRRAAHQLGSAASALALVRLFERCTWLEENAESLQHHALLAAAEELEAVLHASHAALRECLHAPSSASAALLEH